MKTSSFIDKDLALSRAKVALISRADSIFLSTVLFSLNFSWDENIPTAGTDGIELLINPTWFCELNDRERIALLAHETYHVCFKHMIRGKSKEMPRYNYAADYVINLLLLDNGFDLPEGALVSEDYRDMSTDQIYDLLDNEEIENQEQDIIFGGSKEELNELDKEIDSIISRAEVSARMGRDTGNLPTEVLIEIDKIKNPKLPWNQILQNFLSSYTNEDYSYRRPNRKFLPEYILPGIYSEGIDSLAFAVDASGSVSDDEFNEYLAEMKLAREILKPKTTTVMNFNHDITSVTELSSDQSLDTIEFKGGGGTNIHPVLNYFTDNVPTVLVIFTDGKFYKYTKEINYPVIWVIVGNKTFVNDDIGETIYYD